LSWYIEEFKEVVFNFLTPKDIVNIFKLNNESKMKHIFVITNQKAIPLAT